MVIESIVSPSFKGSSLVCANKAVAVGDSLIVTGLTSDATNLSLGDNNWPAWATAYLKQRLTLDGVFGLGGSEISDITNYIIDNVLTMVPLPGWLFTVSGGANILNGDSAATVISELKAFYKLLRNKNIIVVDCTNGPADALNTDALRIVAFEVNQFKMEYARQNRGIVVIDVAALIADGPSSPPAIATSLTSDGTHFTGAGCKRIGQHVSDVIGNIVPSEINSVSMSYDTAALHDYGNMVTNGIFDGTGGSSAGTGASGSVATGWLHVVSGTITSVASKVARSGDDIGENQRLTISGAGASATASMFQTISSNIKVGEECFAQIEIETQSAAVEMAGINLQVICRALSSDIYTVKFLTPSDESMSAPGNIVLRTLPFTIPASTDEIYFQALVTFDSGASSGSLTIDFGRAELRRFRAII